MPDGEDDDGRARRGDLIEVARVLPLTRTRAVKGLFDYRIGSHAVGTGTIVRVPFGGRTVHGVVFERTLGSAVAPERLADLQEVLPARLPSDLVSLAAWMAAAYCSTPARALTGMLPPGALRGLGEKRVLLAELSDAGRAAIEEDGAGEAPLSAGQRAALSALAGGERVASQVGTPVLRRLERRGLVVVRQGVVGRRPAGFAVSRASAVAPSLTAEQAAALAPVLEALGQGRPERFLLHGVTGSGKTEIYLQAVAACLAAGRDAIVLVPEIGLTPQALQRFSARFGEIVAVLHSGLSAGARHDEWLRLARGEARVAVGPRSAVFAPVRDIGLIVVDEEHESSYKHEGDPRYDARGVAERRAADHGAILLAGSATPRPEAVERYLTLRLEHRVDGRPLPAVEILDMRGLHHPLHPVAHRALTDLARSGGKAIVLLNRRGWSNFLTCSDCGRVWMCPNCDVALVLHQAGGVVACHHCGHRERVPSRCLTCGSVSVARHGVGTERLEHELRTVLGDDLPVFRLDADASGLDARARTLERFAAAPAGVLVGTQMVAKGHDFPDVALGLVVDADSPLRFPDFRAEERTFALLTQLAGRAGRGAAADGGSPGAVGTDPSAGRPAAARVLIQTMAPEARPILLAARHDSDGFLRGELDRRRALAYPPFASLIRVVCSAPAGEGGEGGAAALAACDAIRERIETLSPGAASDAFDASGATVLGPAPLFALRGRARAQLVVKARGDRTSAIASVGAAVDTVAAMRAHRDVAISVDVDPQ